MYQDVLVRHYIWLRRESSTNGWRAVIWVILQRALPFFHNDNNYLLKNSCAVFSSSSFSLTLCRINVFLLFLTRYTSLVPLMRLLSVRLHSFTAIFQIPHSICLTLIMFCLYTQIHRAKNINPYFFFGMNPFFYSSRCTGMYVGAGESDISTHPSGFSSLLAGDPTISPSVQKV